MSHGDINPYELGTTEELSSRALELLRKGELNGEFIETAHHLTLSAAEPQAVIEGTLLFVGADLEEIAQAGTDPKGDPTREHFSRDRRLFAFLEFAEGHLEYGRDRKLRPIGQTIVQHCLALSNDDAITATLRRICDLGSQQ